MAIVVFSGGRRCSKTAIMTAEAVSEATPGKKVLVINPSGEHQIRNVTPVREERQDMKQQPQTMKMGDGGPAAYFGLNWTRQEVASWLLRYTGAPVCKPGATHNVTGVRYQTFARGFHEATGSLLLYSREEWAPFSAGDTKVAGPTWWRHLSISFHDNDPIERPESYGHMRAVLPADYAITNLWLRKFFGNQRRWLQCDPPLSEHGKKFDVWHYRLLCAENFVANAPDAPFQTLLRQSTGCIGYDELQRLRGRG